VAEEPLFPQHQPYPPEPDPVDESSEESFPASDAPSTWSREDGADEDEADDSASG
jgi:hypothetical protein